MYYVVGVFYPCNNQIVVVKPGTERVGIWIEYLLVTTTENELFHFHRVIHNLENQIILNSMLPIIRLLLFKGEERQRSYKKERMVISESMLERMRKTIGKM